MVIELPLCPTPVNSIWRTVRIGGRQRTLLSANARKFYEDGCRLIKRPSTPIAYRVKVHIQWYPPDRRIRDIDGILKAILDLLTRAGIWDDDSLVDFLSVERGEVVKGGKVVIYIHPMTEAVEHE